MQLQNETCQKKINGKSMENLESLLNKWGLGWGQVSF